MKLSQVLPKAISIVVLTNYVNILQTRFGVFEFKNDPAVSLLLPFLSHFFPSAGHLLGFILLEKAFGKPFGILELNERKKGRWVVKHDFHGNFGLNVTRFLFFFFLRSHYRMTKLPLTVKTDDVTSG